MKPYTVIAILVFVQKYCVKLSPEFFGNLGSYVFQLITSPNLVVSHNFKINIHTDPKYFKINKKQTVKEIKFNIHKKKMKKKKRNENQGYRYYMYYKIN